MNRFLRRILRAKLLLGGVMSAFVWMGGLWFALGGEVKGLYVGSDFYAPDEPTQSAARSSGFTRLFLSFFHIDEHGDVTYNGTPIIRNGVYVGDPTWSERLSG